MEVRSDSDCASGQTRSVSFGGIFLEVWNLPVRRSARAAAIGVLILGLGAGGMLTKPTKAADRYSEADDLYGALRTQPHTRLSIGGGEIDVVFADGAPGLDRGRIFDWINASARAVTTYFGRFPVRHVGLLVVAGDGSRIGSGTTYGFDGSAIHIVVGRSADASVFQNDWILVHEMTHLALPTVPHKSDWLLEGNATYVEPIARAQAGQLDPTDVWRWSLEGMPKGLPQPGDEGLDYTPTWGRTYWGGAMFWLLADIRIHQRTENRLSVQDALRAINRASGGNTARWTVDQVAATGDRATGTDVLTALYTEMKGTPVPMDLDAVFEELGVAERDGKTVFDDHAPLAAIRRSITEPHAAVAAPASSSEH
jgi:hypothetical protein